MWGQAQRMGSLCSEDLNSPVAFWEGFFFFFTIYLFIWLHWVLAAAHRIFVLAHGLPSCGSWAPECKGSVVVACVGSSVPDRDWTCVPHIARWILNHWITREAPREEFLKGRWGRRSQGAWSACGQSSDWLGGEATGWYFRSQHHQPSGSNWSGV